MDFLAGWPSSGGAASGSSNAGSLADSRTHSSAYSSVKVTSVSALSKICERQGGGDRQQLAEGV